MLSGIYLILGVNVLAGGGIILTYSLAVLSEHVKPVWTFISAAGDYPVESCIFSFVFNMGAAFYMTIIYIRYGHVEHCITEDNLPEPKAKKFGLLNRVSVVLGLLGGFGFSMIGSFQRRFFNFAHLLGVFLCTYLTLSYFLFQTYFSFNLMSRFTTKSLRIFRLFVVVVCTSILCSGIFVVSWNFFHHSEKFHFFDRHPTVSDDPLYKATVVLEWILFEFYQLFILSLYPDFKRIVLKQSEIVFSE